MHDITNNSLRVDSSTAMILHGINNNSLMVDCFRNQYPQIHRITARWAGDFAYHKNSSPRVDSGSSIAGYAGLPSLIAKNSEHCVYTVYS